MPVEMCDAEIVKPQDDYHQHHPQNIYCLLLLMYCCNHKSNRDGNVTEKLNSPQNGRTETNKQLNNQAGQPFKQY